MDQVLGAPKLYVGPSEAQASAVVRQLEDWGVVDKISAMCFDTTSGKTGRRNGACVLIQQMLKIWC